MNIEERRSGIGGSDLGAILGLNPWRTPFQVYQEKTGQAEPFTGNLQTRFGSYAEEFVAREYCEQTGRQVQRFNAMLRRGNIIGHVDRLVIPEGAKLAARHTPPVDTGPDLATTLKIIEDAFTSEEMEQAAAVAKQLKSASDKDAARKAFASRKAALKEMAEAEAKAEREAIQAEGEMTTEQWQADLGEVTYA